MAFKKKKKKIVWLQGEEKGRLTSGISFMRQCLFWNNLSNFLLKFFVESVPKYICNLKKIEKVRKSRKM